MNITFQNLSDDPELLHRLLANARRERAQAMYGLLIAPVVSFVKDTLHAARPHRPLAG
jgi:hypothetical protein